MTGQCRDLNSSCLLQSLTYNTSQLSSHYTTDLDGCFSPEEMKATIMYQHYIKVDKNVGRKELLILYRQLQFSFAMGLLTIVIGSVGLIGKS